MWASSAAGVVGEAAARRSASASDPAAPGSGGDGWDGGSGGDVGDDEGVLHEQRTQLAEETAERVAEAEGGQQHVGQEDARAEFHGSSRRA